MLPPRTRQAPPDESFGWASAGPPGQRSRVEEDARRLARLVGAACDRCFPRRAGYRVHEDQLRGVIRGHRYRVTREGFVGQVSVQVFTTAGAYRRPAGSGVQLRVAGRARLVPPRAPARFPLDTLAMTGLGLLLAAVLLLGGGRGWWAVARNPSLSRLIDGIGFVGAAGMVVLALALVSVVVKSGLELPWARLSMRQRRRRIDHTRDLSRWRRLRQQLAEAHPDASDVEVGSDTSRARTGPRRPANRPTSSAPPSMSH